MLILVETTSFIRSKSLNKREGVPLHLSEAIECSRCSILGIYHEKMGLMEKEYISKKLKILVW
jgi:hypothetical protein